MKKLIDVYVYRLNSGNPEFLLLLRSSKKIYANQWRMVGGKVKEGEQYWEAALRETKEELGVNPTEFWVIPSVNTFYEPKTDQIHSIPAFAILIDNHAEIKLDEEHTEFKWVNVEDIEEMIAWPEQKRLLRLTHHILVQDQILPEWRINS